MAKYWIDHSLYGAYTATPTWGVAQEGDGEAKTMAVPAIASLTITAPAVAGNTITIMGVVLTAVASGASATQFNVGASTSVQATNIATALNAATGQVLATVSQTRHQLRNMIYARAVGDVVEIMTRPGSAYLNHASNAAVAISISGTYASPIVQFAGGASGAWAYSLNNYTGTIWPSALGALAYGVFYAQAGNGTLMQRNLLVVQDAILIRANNVVINMGNGFSSNVNITQSGTFIIDDGTEWPGDTGTYKWTCSGGTGSVLAISNSSGCATIFTTNTNGKFVIESTVGNQIQLANNNISIGGSRNLWFDNVYLLDNSSSGSFGLGQVGSLYGGSNAYFLFTRIKHVCATPRWYSPILGIAIFSQYTSVKIIDCSFFEGSSLIGVPTSPLVASINHVKSAYPGCGLTLSGIKVGVASPPYICTASFTPGATLAGGSFFVAQNVSGCLPYATTGLIGSNTAPVGVIDSSYISQLGIGNHEQFKLETQSVVAWWNPGSGQPVLDQKLFDDTKWSVGCLWLGATAGSVVYNNRLPGIEVFKLNQAVVFAGMTTVTFELLIDGAIATSTTNKHIVVILTYVDDTGATKSAASVRLTDATAALGTSSAAWTKYGYTGHVARKITLILPSAIKINTTLDATILLSAPAPSAGNSEFFFNPDLVLS